MVIEKKVDERIEKVYNALFEMCKFVNLKQLKKRTSDKEVAKYSYPTLAMIMRKLQEEGRVKKIVKHRRLYYSINNKRKEKER